MICLIIVATYLSGYIVSYLCLRYLFVKSYKEWTKADRAKGLFVSIFSWITVLIIIGDELGKHLPKQDDTPASW